MNKKIITILIVISGILLLNSCNKEFQKLLKSNDYELIYTKAGEYYDQEDYSRAVQLYEKILHVFKGLDKGEEVMYKYAECNYKLKDYIIAGYYFRKFSNTYPNSKYAEEALFKSAYCYYLDSPRPTLDQKTTRQAILEFELFLSKFPKSSRVDTCNILIDNLNRKLQEKSFNNAKLYYDLEYYEAAAIALKNSENDYPASPWREETMFLAFKSSYLYAVNSVSSKIEERLKNAERNYNDFIDQYPNSEFRKQADKMYKDIQKRLSKYSK